MNAADEQRPASYLCLAASSACHPLKFYSIFPASLSSSRYTCNIYTVYRLCVMDLSAAGNKTAGEWSCYQRLLSDDSLHGGLSIRHSQLLHPSHLTFLANCCCQCVWLYFFYISSFLLPSFVSFHVFPHSSSPILSSFTPLSPPSFAPSFFLLSSFSYFSFFSYFSPFLLLHCLLPPTLPLSFPTISSL